MTTERRALSSGSSIRTPPAAVLLWPDRRQQQPGWNEPSDALYNRLRPHPAWRHPRVIKQHSQRRAVSRSWTRVQSLLFAVLFGLLVCCQGVGANNIDVTEPLESWTELVFDRSEPPARPMRLQARQETTTSLPASIGTPTSSDHASASASGTISTATPTSQNPLPSPFDSSLGNNFTASSCPTFFQTFLGNEAFNKCLPLSLLLQVRL